MHLVFRIFGSERPKNNFLKIEADPELSVKALMNKIGTQISHPSEHLRLILHKEGNEILLTQNSSLKSLGIQEDSYLMLEILSPSRFEENSLVSFKKLNTQLETPQFKDWLSLIIEKVNQGSLSGLIHAIGNYEREESCNLDDDEETALSLQNADGWTPFHFACYLGYNTLVQLLVARRANCNKESSDGWTPLILASHYGYVDCVRALLKHPDIQINRLTESKGTALHQACIRGHSNIVELLLEANACMTIADQFGDVPLQLATTQEILEMIPKYMGKRELKHIEAPTERCEDFGGEVTFTGSLVLNDKEVYLSLEVQQGMLSCYNNQEEFSKHFEPLYCIRLIDIWCVAKSKGTIYSTPNAVSFILFTKIGNRKYYTLEERLTDEWVFRLTKAIDYCHTNKIGTVLMPNLNSSCELNMRLSLRDELLNSESFISSPEVIKEPASFKSFTILDQLGSGSFGKVFKAIKNDTNKVCALKVLNKQVLANHKQLKYAIGECKILRCLDHPFIISLDCSFQTRKNLYMALEYCPNGDLMTHLSERNKLVESVARFYIAEVILAVEYLHSLDIIYRDLKPENILVDRAGHLRLADFGLAKENVNPLNPAMSFCGSPAYLAPEMLSRTGSEKSADVYGVGAILFEMLTGMPPFYSDNIKDLFKNIKRGYIEFPKFVKPKAQELLKKLLNRDPKKRPSLTEVKSHSFFAGLNWEDLEKKQVKPPKLGYRWLQLDENNEEVPDTYSPTHDIFIDEDYEEEEEVSDSLADFNFAR